MGIKQLLWDSPCHRRENTPFYLYGIAIFQNRALGEYTYSLEILLPEKEYERAIKSYLNDEVGLPRFMK